MIFLKRGVSPPFFLPPNPASDKDRGIMTRTTTATLPEIAERLRERHSTFYYKSYSVSPNPIGLRIDFRFTIAPTLDFSPHIVIPISDSSTINKLSRDPLVNRLAFLIGMVELLSYWKLCCPQQIEIECGELDPSEVKFWEKLIRKGLGEFFFTNKISPNLEFSLTSIATRTPNSHKNHERSRIIDNTYLVLVGGGKDSIVTLELLRRASERNEKAVNALALNPIPASIDAIRAAQYPAPLFVQRVLDPKLRDLNSHGYLNGHTPFSALLAFTTILTAYANGYRYILASNEASASEGNILFDGLEVNHQYSKSYEFERDLRDYISKLELGVDYLSFLRPINELQICALFGEMTQYHSIFRSCNREQTLAARTKSSDNRAATPTAARPGWCANCPKCVFTFLCLRCFLSQQQLNQIFGVDPSLQSDFTPIAGALAGFSEHKPFECVGTYEEVRACLNHLFENQKLQLPSSELSTSLQQQIESSAHTTLPELLKRWNKEHFLNSHLEALLDRALEPIRQRGLP